MSDPASMPRLKFGTFLGVFLPSILPILGLIMYLRFGWVLGQLSLGLTVVVVVLALLITLVTNLSALAIISNIDMGAGGVYYLVSRSLGLETGGAIGIAFYISRTLTITFFSFGLAEAMLVFWPAALWGPMPAYFTPLSTAAIILLITLMAGRSAEQALKLQVPVLILVGLSLLALTAGVLTGPLEAPRWGLGNHPDTAGFWAVFAVFFPCMTGFLAGISLSGDLHDPAHSIPRGTMTSLVIGGAVYLLLSLLLAVTGRLSIDQLADPDFGIKAWTKVAVLGGILVYPAAWGAIFSSALGSILTGPRILQSMSMDGLAPRFLSRNSAGGQPAAATWFTGALALAAVALGDLNAVAKFTTILFLTLYVVINVVAATEKLVAEPSYRPRIDLPWYISMAGALGALLLLFCISPLGMLIAIGLEAGFYIYFKRRALEQQWGDVGAGFWMKAARFALLRLNRRPITSRNWRPVLLVFVKDIGERIELVKLAAALGQYRGVLSVSSLLPAGDPTVHEQREPTRRHMQDALRNYGLEAFCEVNIVQSLHQGMLNISQGHGIAGLKTNTVMFGWSEDQLAKIRQLRIIRDLAGGGKNILLARFNDHDFWRVKTHHRIDLWWGGRENNGDLMLILAFMLTLNREWEKARIHVRAAVNTPGEKAILTRGIKTSLARARIVAGVDITLKGEDGFTTILERESAGADIVFLGLQRTRYGEEAEHAANLERMSQVAKMVLFVQNNSIRDSFPILLSQRETS